MSDESMFKNAPPKLTFLLGAMIGLAIISTTGFFIVLSMLVGDASAKTAKAPANANSGTVAAAANPDPSPTADPYAPTTVNYTLPTGDGVHINGNADAPIKLVVYSDFECPFCKRHNPTLQQVLDKYGDDVALVYRHYPLSFHANAQKEAEASECVGELGGNDAFWKFANAIYDRTTSNGTGFALTALQPLAVEVGVDGTAFQDCLDGGQYTTEVQNQLAEGSAVGVNGTPGSIIVNEKTGQSQLLSGALPLTSFTSLIDAELAKS